MSVWQRFWNWVVSIFKRALEQVPSESYAARYEDIDAENITATISNKLASHVFGDSDFVIDGTGKRAEYLRGVLGALWQDDLPWVTAQAFGKGGMVLVPTVTGGDVVISAANQERLFITARRGRKVTGAVVLAEVAQIGNEQYNRWIDYSMDESGTQTIKTIITDVSGVVVPFTVVPQWANITPEVTIGGTDRVLLAFLRCPRDNRLENKTYGVPITYGAEREVAECAEHVGIYRREYLLTRPMLGLDASLWRSKSDQSAASIATIDQVRRTVQDSDTPFIPIDAPVMSTGGSGVWQHFAPAIRQEAMEARLQSLYRRIEKACSLSQGILTERQALSYANKDEVRAAQSDTFAVIGAMRTNIEAVLDDLAYAVDVLAERFGLTPSGARGSYELQFDWDYSMIESTEQTYKQLSDLQTRGGIKLARLAAWVTGDSEDAAQKEIDEAKQTDAQPTLDFGV